MSFTRSTVGDSDARQSVTDALHWTWSLQLQINRFANSSTTELQAFDSTQEARRRFSQTSLDEHLVLVVGRNLVRALSALRKTHPQLGLGEDVERLIHRLRDVYEHWDDNFPTVLLDPADPRKRGLAALQKVRPDAKPWSFTYGPNGPAIGGVLNLRELSANLEALERLLAKLEVDELNAARHAG